MSDEEQKKFDNPVLAGLVALLAVSLAVGLVLGGVALVGTRILGIGGDSSGSSGASERESAIIPRPSKTAAAGPQYTLATEADETGGSDDVETEPTDEESQKPSKQISLQTQTSVVDTFERIYLSGVYQGGEGALLTVQRLEAGAWADFPVEVAVSGGQFSTYVQTAQTGVNKFRVVDNATGKASNPVSVTVG